MDAISYWSVDEDMMIDGQKQRITLCVGVFDVGPAAVFGIGAIYQDNGRAEVLWPDAAHQLLRCWRTVKMLERLPSTLDVRQMLPAVWALMGNMPRRSQPAGADGGAPACEADPDGTGLSALFEGRIKNPSAARLRLPEPDALNEMADIALTEGGVTIDVDELKEELAAGRLHRTSALDNLIAHRCSHLPPAPSRLAPATTPT